MIKSIKISLVILATSCFTNASAQSYIPWDGIIAAAFHSSAWFSIEKPNLKKTWEGQNKLIVTNAFLALEEAKLFKIKKELYTGLSNTDEAINESGLILLIADKSYQIYELQERTYTALNGYPELKGVIAYAEVDLLLESGSLVSDTVLALNGEQENLMTTSDRLLFLKQTYARMNALVELAYDINDVAQLLLSLYEYDIQLTEPVYVDYSNPIQETINEINNLMIKD